MEDTLIKLIKALQEMAPQVWEVLLRQVYLEAWAKVFWSIVFGFLSFLVWKFASVKKEEWYENRDEEYYFFSMIFASSSAFASIYFFSYAILWFSNPEFYAIRWLLEKLMGS